MSMGYNYRDEMYNDVLEAVKEYDLSQFEDIEECEEKLNENLYIQDTVTGNASGSYFCNAYAAEEAICHNLDILEEALEEFGEDWNDAFKYGAESADILIRCYLLGEIIADVLENEDFKGLWGEAHKVPTYSFIESYENTDCIEEDHTYYLGELLDGRENIESILECESVYHIDSNANIDFEIVLKDFDNLLKTVVKVTNIWR